VKRPPELQAIFDDLDRSAPFESLDDMNRMLARRMREYNAAPQAALGGLSPDVVSQLLFGDWIHTGALRLNSALAPDELVGAPILADAQTLLEYIAANGPIRETVAKNLPRAAVAALLPRLRMPTQSRSVVDDRDWPAPRNEGDVLWLPELRHVLMFAGLLARRKGLRTTPRGRELLRVERAGELYALLFRTFFRELDLRSLSRDYRHEGLQATIAYSFYRLRSAAREWSGSEPLANAAWLESAKDPMAEYEVTYGDFRHIVFSQRVLRPLVQFGLMEERTVRGDTRWKDSEEYRIAPLFGQFLLFEFRGAGPQAR